jgi:signal transduction histidine kinase
VVTLENQRLTANAAALERELAASRERIAATVETERKRIERDLHDGAQQRLVAVSIRLESVTKLLNDDPPRGKAVMRELGDDLERAIAEVRQLGRGGAPRALTRLGLARALELVAKQAPIPTAVEDASLGRYDGEIEAAAYFWCVEGLQNASKHAVGATAVRIVLAERDHGLHLEVSDDGDGFDVDGATANGGFRNIRHRIAAVGGEMTVESAPGSGTRVSATIPL